MKNEKTKVTLDSERYTIIGIALISRIVFSKLTSFASEFWLSKLNSVIGNSILLLLYLISYAFPIFLLIRFVIPNDKNRIALSFHTKNEFGKKVFCGFSALGVCFLCGAIGSLVSLIFEKIGIAPSSSASNLSFTLGSGFDSSYVFYCVYCIILAPIAEELFYRNLLLRAFEKDSKASAVFYGALFFMLLHSPSSMIYAFASGVIYGVIATKYGTLTTICTHVFNNVISLSLLSIGSFYDCEILCYGIECALGVSFAAVAIVWCFFGCSSVFAKLGKLSAKPICNPAILGYVLFALVLTLFAFI